MVQAALLEMVEQAEQLALPGHEETPEQKASMATLELYAIARNAFIARRVFLAKFKQLERPIQELVMKEMGTLDQGVEGLGAFDGNNELIENYELNTFIMKDIGTMEASLPPREGPELLEIFNSARS